MAVLLALAFGQIDVLRKGVALRFFHQAYFLTLWLSMGVVAAILIPLCLPWTRKLLAAFARTQAFKFLPGLLFLAALCPGALRYIGSWLSLLVVLISVGAVLFLFRREIGRSIDWCVGGMRVEWPFALALAVCAGASAYILHETVFGGEPFCVDSSLRVFHAHILNQGRWYLPAPSHPEYYWPEGAVLYEGRWYSQYFPGMVLVELAGLRLKNPTLLPALMAAAVVALTYACGKRLFSRHIGLFGALFVLLSPLFQLQSAILMEHTPATFFLMTALWLGLRDLEKPSYFEAALLGFALGYGCIMRPLTCFGFAFPLIVAYFVLVRGEWRRRWPYWVTGLFTWCIPAAFLFFFNYKTSGHVFLTGYEAQGATFHSLGFTARNGHTPLIGLFNELTNIDSLSEWLFMWPVTSYLFILLLFVVGRSNAKDIIVFSPFVGLLCVYFFYPFSNICLGPRFVAESIPMLGLLTARGIREMAALVDRHRPDAGRVVRRTLAALVIALTLGARGPVLEWSAQFDRVARVGVILSHRLREFRSDPLATVFYYSPGDNHRALMEQAQCLGGTEFVTPGKPEMITAYMAMYPQRHYFLIAGPRFERTVRLDPKASVEENLALIRETQSD